VDALAAKLHEGRVEADPLTTLLDRLVRGQRIPELQRFGERHQDRLGLEGGGDRTRGQADPLLGDQIMLGEAIRQRRKSRASPRDVDPIGQRRAPEIARHPEELAKLGADDDDHVRPRSERVPVHESDDRRHRKP
jgi:hypothetical protein